MYDEERSDKLNFSVYSLLNCELRLWLNCAFCAWIGKKELLGLVDK